MRNLDSAVGYSSWSLGLPKQQVRAEDVTAAGLGGSAVNAEGLGISADSAVNFGCAAGLAVSAVNAETLGCAARTEPRCDAIDPEAREKMELEDLLHQISLGLDKDHWGWETGSGIVDSVKIVREELDKFKECSVPSKKELFRWCGWAPAKANVLLWRILLGRIATNDQLFKRGIKNVDLKCNLCKVENESVSHLMWECKYTSSVWESVTSWIGISPPSAYSSIHEFVKRLEKQAYSSSRQRKGASSIVLALVWKIWELRNEIVFRNSKLKDPRLLVEDVKETSLFWLKCRANINSFGRDEWVRDGIKIIL